MPTCKICLLDRRKMAEHVEKFHGMSLRDYYVKFFPDDKPICSKGNEKKFKSLPDGFSFCGKAETCLCNKEQAESRLNLFRATSPQLHAENARRHLKIASEKLDARANMLNRWSGPEAAQMRANSVKNGTATLARYAADTEWLAKESNRKSEAMTSLNSDPVMRQQIIEKMTAHHRRPEFREKMSAYMRERYKDGENINQYKSMKPEFFYEGTWFRSSWEVEFAKRLDYRDIAWQYEKWTFDYEYEGVQRTYFPDFYLPQYELFVEIHPEVFWDDKMDMKTSAVSNIAMLTSLAMVKNFADSLDNLIGRAA